MKGRVKCWVAIGKELADERCDHDDNDDQDQKSEKLHFGAAERWICHVSIVFV